MTNYRHLGGNPYLTPSKSEIFEVNLVNTGLKIFRVFYQLFSGYPAVTKVVVRPKEIQVYEIWQELTNMSKRTKKFSTFPNLQKKWGVFQNFFGNSRTYNRHRSSFGKLYLFWCDIFVSVSGCQI